MSVDRILMLCGTLALAGSTLTGLRYPGIPLGLPELLGFVFLGGTLARSPDLYPSYTRVLAYGALLLLGVLVGGLNGYFMGSPSANYNQDIFAVAYAATLAVLYGNALLDHPRRVIWLGRALVAVMCLHAAPLVADLVGAPTPTSGWSGAEGAAQAPSAEDRLERMQGTEALTNKADRYQGLTTNPNQLALATALGAVLLPWIGMTVRGAWAPVWWLFGAASLVLMVLTKSSSAMLAVSLAGVLIVVRRLAAAIDDRGVARYSLVWLVGAWALVAPILFLLSQFLDRAIGGEIGGGQASGRFPLWRSAWQGIVRSNFFGVGPGPHAGFNGPFEQEEAHNVWLDLGLQGGLIAVIALVLLLAYVFRRSIRGHTAVGMALFTVFIVIGLSHYLLRHPLYWSLITLPIAINYYYSLPARRHRDAQRRARQQARTDQATTPALVPRGAASASGGARGADRLDPGQIADAR